MYLDQPRGTGLSVVGAGDSYVKNETQVAADAHDFYRAFQAMYPQYASCPVYVCGESYGMPPDMPRGLMLMSWLVFPYIPGGHYVPAIAHRLMQDNTIPLQGLAGRCDNALRACLACSLLPIVFLNRTVGNGFSDPCLQIPMAPSFAYQVG